ncbi:MAG: pyridoxal 5'-phosphate synthase glutaminase subunit PdxT [Thermoplasmatales archaeon]|nr:pyridoxal 5'-phosphate synthase glutaminase subunit PdxT [Thermoplasmatales archaeon]
MVKRITIGVIGIQGAVSEHLTSMRKILEETNNSGEVFIVRNKDDIKKIDALIFPGGESTIISRILYKSGLYAAISERLKEDNLPILGTCAGCVILASEMTDNKKNVKLLSAIDMNVKRNAFGRQRDSFEKSIDIKGFSKPYNAVFIRAPAIEKVWGDCKILAKIDNKIAMVRQGKILAMSFHPELTDDLRIHKYFLDIILKNIS